jgi:hypothetical protein
MAEKNNATCSICGKRYHVCLSCRDSVKLAPWKVHTDTSEHYKIYQIIRGLSTNVLTKLETKERLNNVDLSDLDTFKENIKVKIKDILKEETPVVETVVEVEPVIESIVEPIVEDAERVEKFRPTRKKYPKVETE